MKTIKLFYFGDGRDGIVVAKSIKQAVKIIQTCYSSYSVKEILDSVKRDWNRCRKQSDDFTATESIVSKKGLYKRTRFLGLSE